MARFMRTLSINIDHIATLRQARQDIVPDPVQAAVMAELGGADGITVHLRHDRRHINERDVRLLKGTLKTELNLEMAATPEMVRIAAEVRPAQVSLVPEAPDEITTQGGLDLVRNFRRIAGAVKQLDSAGIRLSAFVEADMRQIEAAAKLGCRLVELNTDRYCREPGNRATILRELSEAAAGAAGLGLEVDAGHGIDYRNIIPLLDIPQLAGFSIGFAVVARAVFTGLTEATREMKRIMLAREPRP